MHRSLGELLATKEGEHQGQEEEQMWEEGKGPTLQPQDHSTCWGPRNPAWNRAERQGSAREGGELPAAPPQLPTLIRLPRPQDPREMNPSCFVHRSGVWMPQDRWGLGWGETGVCVGQRGL